MAQTYTIKFIHRINGDGSIDSICRECFVTIATAYSRQPQPALQVPAPLCCIMDQRRDAASSRSCRISTSAFFALRRL